MEEKRSVRRLISRKAVRELLQDNAWQLDADITERLYQLTRGLPFKVYVSADGRGLYVAADGKGKLYPLKADMFAFIESTERLSQQRPQHILEGRLPYGKDFIQHVPELIEELPTKIRIKSEALDGTLASLTTVEAAVKRLGLKRSLEQPIFAPLVAYIGEVMRIYVNGRWEMRQDGEIWEPWIIDPQGRACNSWSYLFDALNRDGEYASIAGGANVDISFRRPFPVERRGSNFRGKIAEDAQD